jgi:hypothetical protein
MVERRSLATTLPGNVGSRKTKADSTLSHLVGELKCRDNANDIECVL